ncbi:hypothetical protein ABNG03_10170 [Halorubrum sp. RMP-47]|uniref:ubiquitinyl hydrolase 1 n=1 Tax=Halorubrum miltondacostae TaxID=3076378 RepID=A0ABD5M442_9EURY
MTTYVFDFYNLYIPEGHQYENQSNDIRIRPLAKAEEFEEKRREADSKYAEGDWKTAKCYITAENEKEAQRRADWLTFFYSFAQRRRAYWDTYYPHNQGYDDKTTERVLIPRIKNDKLPIIGGIGPLGLDKQDRFIDAALNRMENAGDAMRSDILSTLNLFLNSEARGLFAAKFLFAWIGIERTSEWNYREWVNLPGNEFISSTERDAIEDGISSVVDEAIDESRGETLIDRFTRDHMYEHRTQDKILIYLDYIEPEFDEEEIYQLIRDGYRTRNDIAHEFGEDRLLDNHDLTFMLQKVLVFIIFDLLEISSDLQKEMLLTLHDDPTVSYPDEDVTH